MPDSITDLISAIKKGDNRISTEEFAQRLSETTLSPENLRDLVAAASAKYLEVIFADDKALGIILRDCPECLIEKLVEACEDSGRKRINVLMENEAVRDCLFINLNERLEKLKESDAPKFEDYLRIIKGGIIDHFLGKEGDLEKVIAKTKDGTSLKEMLVDADEILYEMSKATKPLVLSATVRAELDKFKARFGI